MKPRDLSVPICVFSFAVIRCIVVTIVSTAIAMNSTGRTDPIVFPSSLSPIASAMRFSMDIGKTIEEFFDLVHKGDPASTALWDDVLKHLAIGISNIRMIFDCDIVLGGFVSEYLKEYMPELRKYVKEMNSFDDGTDFVKLGKFPRKAGLMGIAWHFANDYIEKI